jgi:UDP-N-acetylmuramyl-tripeptide synthetase
MIQYDSRKVRPGDTFVAVPGVKRDGADFVPDAIANGAKVIVAEKTVAVPAGIEFRKVASARRALAELSAEYYGQPSKKLKLIGVTGTKGKTTVTYLVQSILNQAGYKAELIGTINSPLTTPESADLQKELARMVKQGVTHCVLEVSSHALAQERVHGCHFAIAIFTNLSHDHLDYHHSMAEYLKVKARLFEMLDQDATAIINVDDPASQAIISVIKGELVTFGLGQAKHELRDTKHNEYDTAIASVDIRADEMTLKINSLEVRTPLIGLHNAYNIAAAWQCGLTLGIRPLVIKQGIENVKVIPGRQEIIDCGQPFKVIVDFAHSPDSLQKLLETYQPLAAGKLILVFGCPGDRDWAKRPIMGNIAAKLADHTIITSDDPHSEEPAAIMGEIEAGYALESGKLKVESRKLDVIMDRKEAIKKALSIAQAGDTVLIAGRGHEKFQEVNGKQIPFDDREVVKEILKSKR